MARWLGGLLLFLLLAGCSGLPLEPLQSEEPAETRPLSPTDAAPVRLSLWFHHSKSGTRDAYLEIIADFNASYPGLEVAPTELPEGTYNDQISAAALADSLPCLLDIDGPFVTNYAWSGYLIPLDDYISPAMRADFIPSIIKQGTYNGRLYSLGAFDSGLALWGNRRLLQKAGVRIPQGVADAWDRAEFEDALRRLQQLEEVEYAIDFKINTAGNEWYTYGFSPILQAFGGDLIDRNTYLTADGVINGPESVAAMTWFQNLFVQGYANPEPVVDDAFYGSQTAALVWGGHWLWEAHRQGLGEDLVLIPMPRLGETAVTGAGSWSWGITSSCHHPDEAWAFLEYLLSTENVLAISNTNGAVPARQSAIARSHLYADGEPLSLYAAQITHGVALERPVTAAYPAITAAFATAARNIIAGEEVQTELDRAAEKIERDIMENHGYPSR